MQAREKVDYSTLPVSVLTGFLGSGKTTLLQRLLAGQPAAETALLINEVGDVGIDHRLVSEVAPEVRLLPSGCVCCSIRGELKDALLELFTLRQQGELPPFKRILLETTGLADPAPILATLSHDSQLRHHLKLGQIITLVDAVNAELQQSLHPEWLAQVTAADRLIISKTDLTDQAALAATKQRLAGLNPTAEQLEAHQVIAGDDRLFATGARMEEDLHHATAWQYTLRRVANSDRTLASDALHGTTRTLSITLDDPLDWTHFGIWLSMLLRAHGDKVLRMKGILNIGKDQPPVALHGVQHVLHPPLHLHRWPDNDHRSQLVFITRGLEPTQIERSLTTFLATLAT
ncbi:CobW family GTP-binding protein [Phytohalomonas tamaricis]|uniref:CobW family GTP-binding protein n=1 Tax=Phytohalomonas tamaricis TaxID=2081032 RepID=UPI000D0B4462|nr:GTP-binding protein [Phytohalomonas tamaricis]